MRPGNGPDLPTLGEVWLLTRQGGSQSYTAEALWPAKVRVNLRDLKASGLRLDVLTVLATLSLRFTPRLEPLVDGLLPE